MSQNVPWTSIVTAITAVLALVIAVYSARNSARALRLSERQDRDRQPKLEVALLDHSARKAGSGGRKVSFKLSVRNLSDTNNAIEAIDLHVRYAVDGAQMVAKVPVETASGEQLGPAPSAAIAAHSVSQGWCDFLLPAGLVPRSATQGYEVVVTDTHGATSSVQPIIVREVADEA